MESRTLVCDRCARANKHVIAVDSAVVQTRTHGTFRIDLCEEHRDSLVEDLQALNTGHIVKAIIEHTLQLRAGEPVRIMDLGRISGAGRKLIGQVMESLEADKHIRYTGTTKDRAVMWISAVASVPSSSNGGPPTKRKQESHRARMLAWLRTFLRERKEVKALALRKAVDDAGMHYPALHYATTVLKQEKVVKVKGRRSGATYIYTGA